MLDPFLDDINCAKRLISEYERYGSIIVAYDYDNTVYDYYQKGDTFGHVVDLLRECYRMGFHLIVFTSCNDDRFPEIKEYLKANNIPFDSINETPDFIPFKGRKVYYNILLDDRAGLRSAYEILWKVIYSIKGQDIIRNESEISNM